MGGELPLLWVSWGLTGIAWCLWIVSMVFDDGVDLWRALAAVALWAALLCVAGHLASGGLL